MRCPVSFLTLLPLVKGLCEWVMKGTNLWLRDFTGEVEPTVIKDFA